MSKPRLGHIHFLNVLPLTYGLNQLNYKEGLEVFNGVPAAVNNDLLHNRVDIAEVSSIAYARTYEDLLIMPDLCVRADGEVKSIILVSKKPIEEINEDKIILTAQSATSHTMLRIIMARAYDANPKYYTRHLLPEDPVPNDAVASLFIGDDALQVYFNRDKSKYYYYDLGREWLDFTGHGMVFAVWAVHRAFAESNPEGLQMVYDKLYQGFRAGLQHRQEAIASVQGVKPFRPEQLREYFSVIRWNLTEEYLDSLKIFYKLAYEQRIIPRMPLIRLAKVER